MQIAAKYMTGEPATWGEGDWDGAPGGAPSSPPAGDGAFNQQDIVAALRANVYLIGPYAVTGSLADSGGLGDAQLAHISVPEPTTILLLGWGLIAWLTIFAKRF